MPTPQRVQHNTPAMRKNPSLSRNGGSDAEIMELNQQVELYFVLLPLDSHRPAFHPLRRIQKVFLGVFFKLMELKLTVDGLEKERDFYFGKLRDIELICQEPESENHPILSKIMDILYATEVAYVRPSINSKSTEFSIISLNAFCCLTCRKVLHPQRRMTLMNKLTWARTNTDPLSSLPPENSIFSFLFLFDLICFLLCTLYKCSPLSPVHPLFASSVSFLISVTKSALPTPSGHQHTTHSYSAASFTAPLLHSSNVKHIPVSAA